MDSEELQRMKLFVSFAQFFVVPISLMHAYFFPPFVFGVDGIIIRADETCVFCCFSLVLASVDGVLACFSFSMTFWLKVDSFHMLVESEISMRLMKFNFSIACSMAVATKEQKQIKIRDVIERSSQCRSANEQTIHIRQ